MTQSRELTPFQLTVARILMQPALRTPFIELDEAGRQAYSDALGCLFEAYLDESLQAYQNTMLANGLHPQTVAVFKGLSTFLLRLTAETAVHTPKADHDAIIKKVLDNITQDFEENYTEMFERMAMFVAQDQHQELMQQNQPIQ